MNGHKEHTLNYVKLLLNTKLRIKIRQTTLTQLGLDKKTKQIFMELVDR